MTAESTVKNNVQLKCLCCPSIILQPGFGTLEVTQVVPLMVIYFS